MFPFLVQESEVGVVHGIGAVMTFACGFVYQILSTIITRRTRCLSG